MISNKQFLFWVAQKGDEEMNGEKSALPVHI